MAELDRKINRKNDEPGFKKSIESLEQQLGDLQAVEKKKADESADFFGISIGRYREAHSRVITFRKIRF